MRKFIFPQKDASIYENNPTLNSGLDEILDVGKSGTVIGTGSYAIRSLLQFDISAISESIYAGQIPDSAKFFLNLYIANASNLESSQSIYVYPISQSWTEGTGFTAQSVDNPSDGVSWDYRTGEKYQLPWTGSSWITGSEFSYSFESIEDVRLDVSSVVQQWISGSISNNGFIIKISADQESSSSISPLISFFSKQTHTVFKPTLEVAWASQSYYTGSLVASNLTDSFIGVRNLFSEYSQGTVSRVNLSVREKYPLKTFVNIFSRYIGSQYLPTSSYYMVMDNSNNQIVMPFDEYSSISCDSSGSFFMLDTSGLYSNREYKIFIKVETSEISQIFDTKATFRIR